jgi:DNA helicase-2/ATP-dependent DNA helicase PcrA
MFDYILIDEFQDTNYAQNQLAILLSGEKQNITVVGDDDQAIYRWRGAALSNMIQFRKNFPNAQIVTLTQNYRSSQLILDTAYQIIQHNNPDRLEVKEGINKKLSAFTKKHNYPVELLLSETGEKEAERVVKKIEELVYKSSEKQKYSLRDIAILVRANDHAQLFMRALDRERIPYQFLGPTQLFHQEEIKDIIAYVKILANPEDAASFYRVLTMPIFALHPVTISVLLNTAKRRNISILQMLYELESISLQEQEKEKLSKLLAMLQNHLGRIAKESSAQIIFSFLQESGLFKKLVDPQDATFQMQAQNISKFFDKLKSYESEHNTTSVYEVIEWIDLLMQMGESPQASVADSVDMNAINILTVHASKGLEFPIVFVVNLVKERFPSRQRSEQIPIPQDMIKEILPEGDYHIEEERRLFYVAITRAKEKLFYSASSFYGEGKREKRLSPFIAESVGEELIGKIKQEKAQRTSQLSLLDFLPSEKRELILPATSNSHPLTKITYLSYSQIQTFETCPLHYKLRYILKVPTPQTTAQTFGTSIHAALRDFYQRRTAKEQVSVADISSILKRVWITEGYQSKEHEQVAFERAVTLLEDYLVTELATNPNPIGLELPFEFFVNKVRIGGRIDRIDKLPDGSIEIIDYKTGANVPTEKDVAKNLQLTTYALAASSIHDKIFQRNPDQILLSLYYIEQGKKLTTTRTPEQLEEAKEELLQAAQAIEQSDFSCSKSIFCQNCEYKMLCNTH